MLTPEAEAQVVELIEIYKNKIKTTLQKEIEQLVGDIYTDIIPYIETDAWFNFRKQCLEELCDISTLRNKEFDFKKIRQKIYEENKEEIVALIGKDLVEENQILREQYAEVVLQLRHRHH